jgi:hypothetical protein
MYYFSVDESTVLFTIQDSPDCASTIFTNVQIINNIPILQLESGWFDGDVKDIVLAQNDNKRKIQIILPLIGSKKNGFMLQFTTVGQSVALVWSHRFQAWFIRNNNCEIISI